MERIPRQFYTDEFRHEAVSLGADGGLTVAEVNRLLLGFLQNLNTIKLHHHRLQEVA